MADLLELTAELVAMPSVSFEESTFVDWLEDQLGQLDHLETVRVGDNLVARTNLGRTQRLVIAGHTDTVPPNGNAQARIDGDTLWGVGSADMKGGLAVALQLAREVTNPRYDLTFIFYAREEVAQEHNGLNELTAERPDLLAGDCAILGEPTSALIEAGCQGAMRFQLTLAGARAHTARPWMGRNALHRLGPVLAALAAYEARTPTIDGCVYREAIQAVSVEGGVAGNVVPDQVVLKIHHRYAPDRSPQQAESFVRELLAPHIELAPDAVTANTENTDGAKRDESSGARSGDESARKGGYDELVVLDQSPACLPSMNHPILQKLVTDNNLEVKSKLGWTDVARFDQLGIPATNFGPGDATVAHAADERLERSSIESVYSALRALVQPD